MAEHIYEHDAECKMIINNYLTSKIDLVVVTRDGLERHSKRRSHSVTTLKATELWEFAWQPGLAFYLSAKQSFQERILSTQTPRS